MQTTDSQRDDAAAATSDAVNNLVQLGAGAGGSSNHFNITNNNHTTFNYAHTHHHHHHYHYGNIAPAQSPTNRKNKSGNYKNGEGPQIIPDNGNDAADDSGDTDSPRNKPPPQKEKKVMPCCIILFYVQLRIIHSSLLCLSFMRADKMPQIYQ